MQDIKKQRIKELISTKKIVTLDEIKLHLQTDVTMTIMRKLHELSYLSSYSHRGKYYTLTTIPRFSELGLWSYQSVHFSKYDTLVNTCLQIISNSVAGYSVKELDEILEVSVRLSTLNLFKAGELFRAPFGEQLVYFSTNNRLRKQQIAIRESQFANEVFSVDRLHTEVITEELKAATILFYSTLNEKQRRLYAGLEAIKIGHGGDKLIGGLLQINPETVSKGREELVKGDFQRERIRKTGAGRPEVKKNSGNNKPD
ncbi:MAG: hypothetical protein ACREHG_03530 [Candidatus Saccharimonadales bacterium]